MCTSVTLTNGELECSGQTCVRDNTKVLEVLIKRALEVLMGSRSNSTCAITWQVCNAEREEAWEEGGECDRLCR